MRGSRRLFVYALAVVAGLAAVVMAAWAVDVRASDGEVLRNVALAGRDVSGMTRAEVAAVVSGVAGAYAGAPIEVDAGGGRFSLAAADIGLTVDQAATVEAVLALGRDGNPAGRVRDWLASFVRPRKAPVEVRADEAAVHRVVAAADVGRTPPTEPSVRPVEGGLEVVKGAPGLGVDPAAVIDALPDAARGGIPIKVRVRRGPVPPRVPMAEARRLAAVAEEVTRAPLAVTVDGHQGTVAASKVRSWLRSAPVDAGLRIAVDQDRAAAEVGEVLADVGTPPVDASFTVVDGVPQIVPGRPGTACCGVDAGARIEQAFQARMAGGPPIEPVDLPVRPVEPDFTVEEATALGIKEQVGTFTTNHPANQPRVANIHRIADLVRGQVIRPGTTFSVNEFVGERTVEKGFVVDHVIEDGVFTDAVGGGISQFATTTFNAAFFAGLEFPEYQSHSLYIARYPYGREATLSYPKPDLRIRNPSPYGVLIWPTYTGRSITVTLYSTRWVDVAQTNQTREQRGPCTRVRTERTRTFLADGTTKVDNVNALYRPAEGVKCT